MSKITQAQAIEIVGAAAVEAVADFAYNVGLGNLRASALRRRVNAREWDTPK